MMERCRGIEVWHETENKNANLVTGVPAPTYLLMAQQAPGEKETREDASKTGRENVIEKGTSCGRGVHSQSRIHSCC